MRGRSSYSSGILMKREEVSCSSTLKSFRLNEKRRSFTYFDCLEIEVKFLTKKNFAMKEIRSTHLKRQRIECFAFSLTG